MSLTIDCEEVTTIINDFIKNYVDASGCNHVVVGLSGGVDSAVAAVLCQQALGSRNVLCLFMPETTTPADDTRHVTVFLKKFNLKSKKIDITPVVKVFRENKEKQVNRLILANMKARIRMIKLYTYANQTQSLVCGTSNKSELLIGYFTKYGDGGVDFQPLGDLYKTQVFQLAKYLHIPKPIISKPPTAGLWAGQTDEQEIGMPYSTLDKILYGLELKMEPEEIQGFAHVSPKQVEHIRRLRAITQHKRRSPLIPKIGVRTPGLDWRAPVQEG